jgi:hypothetical protein
MIAGREDAPDIDTWLKLAYDCHCPRLTAFAGYIKAARRRSGILILQTTVMALWKEPLIKSRL